MECLTVSIDGLDVFVYFELIGDEVDVLMIDGVPIGVLPVTYINEVKSKIMECME
jgi:hypothetical protein